MKFVYPAIFTKEEACYLVSFPDFEGCQTYGENLIEAYEMAKEVMEAFISDYFGETVRPVPQPTDPTVLTPEAGAFVSLVYTDFDPAVTYAEGKAAAEEYERNNLHAAKD